MRRMEPGRTLLHYRLVDKIGEGGMGVVWKAVDTTLGRDVAIKFLPPLFSEDPDRLARFEREARLLASLNHPNIATVHGLHEADGMRFLAMEFVEGEDLASRLERGPMPLEDVLAISKQIAAALEAAHASGVIHRDLKPANVVLTADGEAKVLDFGLAKAADPSAASASGSLSLSPTMTSAGTQAGMILGTAAYMSPEQARGKPVDRRTDLWSFGALLYECLTGVRLFHGETVSDSLAAILRKEPDWSALPDGTPPLVRLLVRRCLARDPKKRLQDAGDARIELEQAVEDPRGESLGLARDEAAAGVQPTGRPWVAWAIAFLAALVAVFFAMRGEEPAAPEMRAARRLMIPVPGPTEFGDYAASPPAVSPDGRFVAFGAIEKSGEINLRLRPLDGFTARPLSGTEGAKYAFWSPDSRHIGFFRGGKLRRIEVASGRIQSIGGEGSSFPRGGSWNEEGQIVFAPNSNTGIHLIDAMGGTAKQITKPDPEIPDGSHRWPVFLPDGQHYLFVLWTNDPIAKEEHGGVYVASIADDDEPTKVVSDASSVAYAPPGYLLVMRESNLIAVPFDADERRVSGDARVITSGVLRNRSNGHGAFSVSTEGTLVFASGQAFTSSTLRWYDRAGIKSTGLLEPAPYSMIRLAPEERLAAASIPGDTGDDEIWILDLDRGVRTRLVHGSSTYTEPIWSADDKRILYNSQELGANDFYMRSVDGSGDAQSVLLSDLDKALYDWSPDGNYLAYWPVGSGGGTSDIWIYSLERRTSELFVGGDAAYTDARFSPEMRWISYVSDDSGRPEVFVQAFDREAGVNGGGRWQLSTGGGTLPHWRTDGREVVYLDPDRRMMAVSIETGAAGLEFGVPHELFTVDERIAALDASGDHQRFLIATRDEIASEPLRVILDWQSGL
jgi:tRNA A-37 threonylcarbamoyl transferase component Bud32